MSEDILIRHCAPTLAGLKTGNIFTVSYLSEEELTEDLCRFNSILNEKGLRVMCLRKQNGRALIYLFRPGRLHQDLSRSEAKAILQEFGYIECHPEACVPILMDRLSRCRDFPHEIGLFLGYPPEDVKGFITSCGRDCKTCGYWKVYGDKAEAEKQFHRFRKCTEVYCKCMKRGIPLEKLAVKVRIS